MTYDPEARIVSVRGPGRPPSAADGWLPAGVLLRYRQFTWNRGHDSSTWLVLYEDGSLFMGRGEWPGGRPRSKPLAVLGRDAVEKVRGAVRSRGFFSLASRHYRASRRGGCGPDCAGPSCAGERCYERDKTSTGRNLRMEVSLDGLVKIVSMDDAGAEREKLVHPILEALRSSAAGPLSCPSPRSPFCCGDEPFWRCAVD